MAAILQFPEGRMLIDREMARITEGLGCPVPIAKATATREWIEGLVRMNCRRAGLTADETAMVEAHAIHLWRAWCSPAECVRRAKILADDIARERDPMPPSAA